MRCREAKCTVLKALNFDGALRAYAPTEIAAVEAAKLQRCTTSPTVWPRVNNPLANIATRAQTLLADEPDPERRRKLATIVQQAFRAHEMIADLMLFARPPALRSEAVDLAMLASAVVAELAEQAREQGTHLVRTGDPGPLLATADPTQIAVALKALIQNSLEALIAGGSVAVAVERIQGSGVGSQTRVTEPPIAGDAGSASANLKSEIPNLKLSVTDTGPGIPPEIRPHIFDPYYSGREAGRGLGLGLSKAWRIAELHGGRIEVESEAGRGAKFAIVLPAPIK
jgi:signal transduction histidine kinase